MGCENNPPSRPAWASIERENAHQSEYINCVSFSKSN